MTQTYYHVTRVEPSGDIVECYGHPVTSCDATGCAGRERYLGAIDYVDCPEGSHFYAVEAPSIPGRHVAGFLSPIDSELVR